MPDTPMNDGMPLMSTVEERMARALLEEAARRLRWADAYENHR